MAQAKTIPNTTRRGFLSVAAGAAVLPAAVVAQPVDPIFAVIERCVLADKEFGVASIATDKVAAEQEGRSVTQADLDRWEAASDQIDKAVEALVSTTPTTTAGLAAAVEWLLIYEEGSFPCKSANANHGPS